MNKKIFVFFVLVLGVGVMLSGCINESTNIKNKSLINKEYSQEKSAIEECITLCKTAKNEGVDLSNGPCLSELPNVDNSWNISNWVCDVAHYPRKDVDNIPKNQCQKYRLGDARHFVEVDPTCKLIRAI